MKKIIMAALLAATALTNSAGADMLRDTFVGANGGKRAIESFTVSGDVTTFTVKTTRADGTVKVRDFTATREGDQFVISGNGKKLFKDFLSAHAAEINGLNTVVESEEQDLNRLAFDAFIEHRAKKFEDAGNMAVAEKIRGVEYKIGFDFIGKADALGLDWRPAPEFELFDFSDLEFTQDSLATVAVEAQPMTNEEAYIAFNELRGNTVYTDYKWVSSIDWVHLYEDLVARRAEQNQVDTDAYNAAVEASMADVAASNAAYDAQVQAALEEKYGQQSSRLRRHREVGVESLLANPYIIGERDSKLGFEYLAERGYENYDRINVRGLEAAHADGWTGKGIVIGVSDTQGYRGHGDYVASAALAVAPGAIVPNRDDHGYHRTVVGADIVNISSGQNTDNPDEIDALAAHTAAFQNITVANNPGALFVTSLNNVHHCQNSAIEECYSQVAAHNQGLLNGDWIFVRSSGQYESHGVGSSDAKYHTLTADGITTERWRGAGTSFATPKVSGAAALVMQKYPNLSAGQVKNVLLDSAFTDFEGYNIDHHGRGILDVGAALSPIGGIN